MCARVLFRKLKIIYVSIDIYLGIWVNISLLLLVAFHFWEVHVILLLLSKSVHLLVSRCKCFASIALNCSISFLQSRIKARKGWCKVDLLLTNSTTILEFNSTSDRDIAIVTARCNPSRKAHSSASKLEHSPMRRLNPEPMVKAFCVHMLAEIS